MHNPDIADYDTGGLDGVNLELRCKCCVPVVANRSASYPANEKMSVRDLAEPTFLFAVAAG